MPVEWRELEPPFQIPEYFLIAGASDEMLQQGDLEGVVPRAGVDVDDLVLNLLEDVIQRFGDFPPGKMLLHLRKIADVADVIADARLVDEASATG